MSNTNLNAAITRTRLHGPDRVVVGDDQHAVGYGRAVNEFGINPTIIFIRDDGWTLGAPEEFERAAYTTWPNHWIAFIRKPENNARSMSEYPAEIAL